MHVYTESGRNYRGRYIPRSGELSFQVVAEESDLWITCRAAESEQERLASLAGRTLQSLRGQIRAAMEIVPEFGPSLSPLPFRPGLPEIATAMIRGSAACGVGPMAAVAGAVAQRVAETLKEHCIDVLVENGGDLYIFSSTERIVGLLPHPEEGVTMGLQLSADSFPTAVCASSASIGHSLSLGTGDLAVALAPDAALADAAATSLCNRLRSDQDIEPALKIAQEWDGHGLTGVFLQCGDKIGAWGSIELTAIA